MKSVPTAVKGLIRFADDGTASSFNVLTLAADFADFLSKDFDWDDWEALGAMAVKGQEESKHLKLVARVTYT